MLCTPQTPAFFETLKEAIRDEKFKPRSSADRVAELEGLQVVAEQGAEKADKAVAQLTAPADRLRKLLTAPDKKAMVRTLMLHTSSCYAACCMLQLLMRMRATVDSGHGGGE